VNQILIMSSDPILKKKNIAVLTENGFEVSETSHALDGLLKIDKNGFDTIIIDEELADTDGYEACQKIRQYSDTPIILLGVESEENVWAKIEELGFDIYLKKPVSPRELMARVKALMRRPTNKTKSKDKIRLVADTMPVQMQKTAEPEKARFPELQQTMTCPSCGAQNLAGQKFCGTCATRLVVIQATPVIIPPEKRILQLEEAIELEEAIKKDKTPQVQQQAVTCTNCGAQNPVGQKFCGSCATRLTPDVKSNAVAPSQRTGQVQAKKPAKAQQQTIFCPYCGSPNSVGQKFCGTCAARLVIETQGTPVTPLKETMLVKLDSTIPARPAQAPLATKEPAGDEGVTLRVWQDARVVKLIDALVSGRLNEINPVIDVASEGGFNYPEVDRLLQVSGNETRNVLEELANGNILDRKPFETLIIDPEGSFQLVPVERCPNCDAGNLAKGQLIEHFTCGNVGLDLDYRSDHKYICPKCKRELQFLGTDYHYVGTQYRCRSCNNTFPKPAIKWRNMKTSKIWSPEQLGESSIYSYILKEDKKTWLEFQLKPKTQLVEFLKVQGYQVEESARIQGKSGAVHTIDILATRNEGLAIFHLGVGILIAPPGEGEVRLEGLFKFDTIAYDTGINYRVAIAIPKLSPEATKFAERQKIGVFEATEPSALISFLDSQSHLSPAVLPGRYRAESDAVSGRGELAAFLRHRGYEVFEKARIIGKSGAEHIFDIFAQRDDAIIRPTIAITISNADEGPMGVDKVSQFDAEAYDSGIQNKVIIGIPKVSQEGKQLAKQQRIRAIDEHELTGLLNSWSAAR
jgi:DNA-binding response OmpR family regulator